MPLNLIETVLRASGEGNRVGTAMALLPTTGAKADLQFFMLFIYLV